MSCRACRISGRWRAGFRRGCRIGRERRLRRGADGLAAEDARRSIEREGSKAEGRCSIGETMNRAGFSEQRLAAKTEAAFPRAANG